MIMMNYMNTDDGDDNKDYNNIGGRDTEDFNDNCSDDNRDGNNFI